MLQINRLRVEINTENGVYGIDKIFHRGLNFVASRENTCGKSSILAAIYYCLGLEQILGGVGGIGSKVLTSAFKSSIDDDRKTWRATESGAYLEISNGNETVTIYRNIKAENRDNRLVTVFYGEYDQIGDSSTQFADYYVNIKDAATREKGFHTFLAEFLHLELPLVRTSDGNERKLYLQIIFSSMFIEQKHGWMDILSGMPVFGIRESKKRVVEFLLGLDTLKNEKERDRLKDVKAQIEYNWDQEISELQRIVHSETCEIINLPLHPRVLKGTEISRIAILTSSKLPIANEIIRLKSEHAELRQLKPRVLDNFDALNMELSETETAIFSLETNLSETIKKFTSGNEAIFRLTSNLRIVNEDIRNNEDAARLQKFGSEAADGDLSVDICPTCKQHIQDNLLSAGADSGFMSIEENIRHLKEQKKMIEFSLNSYRNNCEELQREKQHLEAKLQTLRRLAQTLRSDLNTTTDTEASEAIMLKRIEITGRIEHLSKLQDEVATRIEQLGQLSRQWNDYLNAKDKLPTKAISDSDERKIKSLKEHFIDNLKRYHYSSLSSFEGIDISIESLLPTIDGFDMKFDSSASDGIRVIWAFTMALLQVSSEMKGNHPGVIIFDEPAQQSIVPEDMDSFISSAAELGNECQIITAITLNSQELISIIEGLDAQTYHLINIIGKAFKLFEQK